MKTVQSFTAVLCAGLLTVPLAPAQEPAPAKHSNGLSFSGFTQRYKPQPVEPINLRNSNRLEMLLRGGKIYLSLQDAIALALENNLDIEIQRYGPRLAQADLLRAEAGGVIRGVPVQVSAGPTSAVNLVTGGFGGGTGTPGASGGGGGGSTGTVFQVTGTAIPNFDPVVNWNYSYGQQSNPQTNSFVTGITSLVVRNYGSTLNFQKQYVSGTGVQLSWATNNIRSNSPNNDLNPFNRADVTLQITQRLLQGFGLAVNNRNIRIARNDLKVSDLTFKQQVITTASSIINLYWDLVSFNEDVKVRRQALSLAEKLFSDNKKQVEIGTLAPIEIVRAEAEVARTQQELTTSETQVLQQETIIKNALSRTGASTPSLSDARIIPTDQFRIADVEPVQPIQDLVAIALENRPEIEQTRIQIDNTKIGLSGARSQLLPSLDFFVTGSNNALAGSLNELTGRNQIPGFVRTGDPFFLGGYSTVLRQLFGRNFPDYNVGFQLNVPLRNRQSQADYLNDTLRLRQQELNQQKLINSIRVDVQNALIGVQQARARHQAAQKTRTLQEQTLDAEQKKFALGSSTIFLVIQAQRDLASAQATEVSALTTYSRSKVQLDIAMGTTLSNSNISLDEAMKGQVGRAPNVPAVP